MNENEDNAKIAPCEYGAASIPRDELLAAYRYFKWDGEGRANGEPPPRLPPLHSRLPPVLLLEEWKDTGSFETWIRRRIEATHKFRNAVAYLTPPLPGVDPALDAEWEAHKKCCKDLAEAMRIAEQVCRDVLMDREALEMARKEGRAEGLEEGVAITQKQLLDRMDRMEREKKRLKKSRYSLEEKLANVKRQLAENEKEHAELEKIKSARDFMCKCRDFVKTCYRPKNNMTEAVRRLLEQDWFKSDFRIHNTTWWPTGPLDGQPNERNPTGSGRWQENFVGAIRKSMNRCKDNGWMLDFER